MHNIQDLSRIPQKYHKKLQIVTDNIHTLCLFVGDRWMDAQTVDNIYSIFRDKLLLLGEHVFVAFSKNKLSNICLLNTNFAKMIPKLQ